MSDCEFKKGEYYIVPLEDLEYALDTNGRVHFSSQEGLDNFLKGRFSEDYEDFHTVIIVKIERILVKKGWTDE